MKKFITHSIYISFICIFVFLVLLSLTNGYTDPFYLRFTTPKNNNLIIGTSRAAQGILPEIIRKTLKRDFLNYSFTIRHSPYGSTYLNSIKRKILNQDKNGIFILAIDPWSISSLTNNPNDSLNFREVNTFMGKLKYVNHNPNFFYLIPFLKGNYYRLFTRFKYPEYLHKNGWLEVEIPMDSVSVSTRTDFWIQHYNSYLTQYKYSSERLDQFSNTIKFLKKHGKVFVIRLPISGKMMDIENQLMPDLNNKIESALFLSDGYLDLNELEERFTFTDGHHLSKLSGKEASKIIGEWIEGIISKEDI